MESNHYDLVVIGSGPAGQKSAICAAKLKKKVCVIERKHMIGGVCLHTGTIPSKTLREAVLHLTGFRQRAFYGKDYSVKDSITVADLTFRVDKVVKKETEVVHAQLKRNGITLMGGVAKFIGPNQIEVDTDAGARVVSADYIMIACGTRPSHTSDIDLDGKKTFDSDQLRQVEELPRELIVVGAGVIGIEYASMFAAMNIKVTIIDQRPTILDFVDREIIDALCYHMRRLGSTFRLGEKVMSVRNDDRGRVVAYLESGKQVHGDALLYTVGRQANTDILNLPAAGVVPDARGRIAVNEHFQTQVPHIYAAGDVIGFPSLASSSMEQGRLASCHMFGVNSRHVFDHPPYGIYTIPEISMVGQTEEELTKARVPYEIGISKYEELAKGQMLGDELGLLKLLFDRDSLKLLGVHIIGDRAAEIVHIGQAVLTFNGTIEYFRDAIFNYPTLAEAYKVAALDGLNRL
jgi:NAD(P) transhydrogenase